MKNTMHSIAVLFLFLCMMVLHCYGGSAGISKESIANITLACEATKFSEICYDYMLSAPELAIKAALPHELVNLSIKFAADEMSSTLHLASAVEVNNPIADDCKELLSYADDLLQKSQDEDLTSDVKNVQHWLSASLTYSTDCYDSLNSVSLFRNLSAHISDLVNPLISNALSMVEAFSSNSDNFTGWNKSSPDSTTFNASDWQTAPLDAKVILPPSAIVTADGSFGTHTSIQAAVDDAPEFLTRRYVIYIKAGTYNERVSIPPSKPMLMFLGDGIDRTIITANACSTADISTFRTATLAVNGDRFLARGITVENTAGPYEQAVAMRVDSDMATFYKCSFYGFQDTLYTHALRQFYRECIISGSIDFIFGNAASIFQNCEIFVRPGRKENPTSTITAQGRTDPAQGTAFVCQSCTVRGTPAYNEGRLKDPKKHNVYLGRPWREYARAIFIDSYLEGVVHPRGWLEWNNDLEHETTMLGEYRSFGPGANNSARVPWSKQLSSPLSVMPFTVVGLIQGAFWLPYTAIPYRLFF